MQDNRATIQKKEYLLPDIGMIVRDIRKRWKMIILIGIAAAFFAGTAAQLLYRPEYCSNATFTIGKKGWADSTVSENLSVADSLSESLEELTQSSLLEHRVCEKLGVSALHASIVVNAVEASNLMTVTVTADSPRSAWEICNGVLDVFRDLSGSLMQDATIRVMQEPQIPLTVSNPPQIKIAMEKGGIAGVLAVLFWSVLCSYWRDTIRKSSDLTDRTGTVLLGSICRERKYKTFRSWLKQMPCPMNIEHPGLSFSYVEGYRMLAGQIRYRTGQTGEQILLVTSVSENEGKSTVAANLALTLQKEGATVLLMDLDFAKPAQHRIFQLDESACERFHLIDALQNEEPLRMKRMGISETLPVVFNTSSGHQVLSRSVIRYLKKTLQELRREFDYILLDSSPLSLVAETEVLADLADASILVVREDWTGQKQIREALDLLGSADSRLLGCVLNQKRGERTAGGRYGYYGYGKYRYGYYGKYSRKEGRNFR